MLANLCSVLSLTKSSDALARIENEPLVGRLRTLFHGRLIRQHAFEQLSLKCFAQLNPTSTPQNVQPHPNRKPR